MTTLFIILASEGATKILAGAMVGLIVALVSWAFDYLTKDKSKNKKNDQ